MQRDLVLSIAPKEPKVVTANEVINHVMNFNFTSQNVNERGVVSLTGGVTLI